MIWIGTSIIVFIYRITCIGNNDNNKGNFNYKKAD